MQVSYYKDKVFKISGGMCFIGRFKFQSLTFFFVGERTGFAVQSGISLKSI